MHISVRWLNQYLEPANVSADEAENTLMNVGFPSESRTELPGGDCCLDVEVTSNRGDVLCHFGMAGEVAAASGRALKLPPALAVAASGEQASKFISLVSPDHVVCPLFTARVIRGVKVGPSPAWLREALEACGQRSISNVVDISNYIALELGNPCHVFDLAKLAGSQLVVRSAKPKERLTTLDGKVRELAGDEIVVADAERAQSLAGVIGGADSQVTEATVDVVLEMATWDPVAVRRSSRRHAVRTDASYRFERIVDARTIKSAAERAAAMIVQVAGGSLCAGSVEAGSQLAAPLSLRLRVSRVCALLGATLSRDAISAILNKLAIATRPDGDDVLVCTVPPQRRDLTREVDLIEEVARVRGLDAVDVHVKLPVTVKPPQNSELARRDLAATLTGMGFFETVTFSFVTREAAAAFLPRGMKVVEVSEDRRKAEPACRPSILPGLLACRRANQHGGVRVAGGVRLFEVAAVFAQDAAGKSVEEKKLALMVDVPFSGKAATVTDRQQGLRLLRGAIEAMVRNLAGAAARVKFAASSPNSDGLDASGFALVSVDDIALGYAGFVSAAQNNAYDLPGPVAVAELSLEKLMTSYPPRARIVLPPEFPGIERDVSFIVDEAVTWEQLEGHIRDQHSPMCEGAAFVGTFRGTQIGKGKKSMTVRLSYRDPARTLRHEEIDGPVAALIEALRVRVGATLRT